MTRDLPIYTSKLTSILSRKLAILAFDQSVLVANRLFVRFSGSLDNPKVQSTSRLDAY